MTKDSAEEKLIRINCDRAGAIFSKIWGFLPGTTYFNSTVQLLQSMKQLFIVHYINPPAFLKIL